MKKKKQKSRIKTDILKMTAWLDNAQNLLPGKFTLQLHPCVEPDPNSWLAGKEIPFTLDSIEFRNIPAQLMGLLDNAQRALSGGRPILTFAETDHPHLLVLHSFGMNGNKPTKIIFCVHVIFCPEPKQLKTPIMLPGGELITALPQ